MSPPLNLYVSSNGVDHGPLTLEEATERVSKGEFKPDDLSWHQGVSGWVPMKQLPEWPQINKTPLPSLTGQPNKLEKKTPPLEPSSTKAQFNKLKKQPQFNQGTSRQAQSVNQQVEAKEGMSLIGKLMVIVAILVFLSTLGVVGFLIYKNLDKFIPPEVEPAVEQETVKPAESKKEEEEETENEEGGSLIDAPDPFAPPEG